MSKEKVSYVPVLEVGQSVGPDFFSTEKHPHLEIRGGVNSFRELKKGPNTITVTGFRHTVNYAGKLVPVIDGYHETKDGRIYGHANILATGVAVASSLTVGSRCTVMTKKARVNQLDKETGIAKEVKITWSDFEGAVPSITQPEQTVPAGTEETDDTEQ